VKTIRLEEPGRFAAREEATPPEPGTGEVLVRVRRVGICGTDVHAYHGRQPFLTYPRILGHELGVEVAAVGAGVEGLRTGDWCAVEPYLDCRECIACRRGRPNCCARLQVLGVHVDGGMREYLTVPARKLHRGAGLSLEQLALVETLGIGAHAVDRGAVAAGEFALVIGAGPIGLAVLQFARTAGARTIVLDLDEGRLAFARERLGADFTVRAGQAAHAEVAALTNGDLPTVVFDATGSGASMERAVDYVAPGGRLVLVGLYQGMIAFADPELHRRELSILATRNSTSREFRHVLALLQEGRLDTAAWITHRMPAAALPSDFSRWLEPESGLIKGVVEL
jgi:2-desacetyl-2-hydroxyethyl bacteriochlorophyllide A dehydrogenase